MGALELIGLQTFLVSIALTSDPLPAHLQREVNTLLKNEKFDTNLMVQILDAHDILNTLFRNVRVVEGLRSHQYEVLYNQGITAPNSLPTETDWLRLGSKVLSATDSVAKVKKLLLTEPVIANYVQSISNQLI
ncbi:MAG: hypothetical protein WBB28_26485 [Crinalium sp.]